MYRRSQIGVHQRHQGGHGLCSALSLAESTCLVATRKLVATLKLHQFVRPCFAYERVRPPILDVHELGHFIKDTTPIPSMAECIVHAASVRESSLGWARRGYQVYEVPRDTLAREAIFVSPVSYQANGVLLGGRAPQRPILVDEVASSQVGRPNSVVKWCYSFVLVDGVSFEQP